MRKSLKILSILFTMILAFQSIPAKYAHAESVKKYEVSNQMEFYNAFKEINRDTENTEYVVEFTNDILFDDEIPSDKCGEITRAGVNVTILGKGHTASINRSGIHFLYLGEVSVINLGDPNKPKESKLTIKSANKEERIHSAVAFEAGTVNMYDGVTIKDIDSMSIGGAFYSIYFKYDSAGELNIYGGKIENVGCGYTNYLGGAIAISSTKDRKPKVNIKGGVIDSSYCDFTKRPKNSAHTQYNDYGGAIYLNNVDFTMSGGTIQNSKAELGAAITAFSDTSINITGGNIINNTAEIAGGAIYAHKGVNLTITGGNITENTASEAGGILAVGANVNISGGVIANNNADGADDLYITKGSTLKLVDPKNFGKLNSTNRDITAWYSDGVEKLNEEGRTAFFLKWSKPANENMDVDRDGTDDAKTGNPFYHKVSANNISGTLTNTLFLKAAHGPEIDISVNKKWSDNSKDKEVTIKLLKKKPTIVINPDVEGWEEEAIDIGMRSMPMLDTLSALGSTENETSSEENIPEGYEFVKGEDGQPITLTLNNENSYSGVFKSLPKYEKDGKTLVEYKVYEVKVDGYTASMSGDQEKGFVVTNTRIEDPTPTPELLEVTFINDNKEYAKVKVEKGNSIDKDTLKNESIPGNPSKDGYKFKGWNTKEDGTGVSFTGETIVEDNIMVYALYEKVETPNPNPNPDPGNKPSPNLNNDKPKTPDTKGLPKTGDSSNSSWYGTLMGVSGMLFVALGIRKRRKEAGK